MSTFTAYLDDQDLIRMEGGENVTAFLPFTCLLYTSPSPRDRGLSRMPSSA